MSFNKLKVEALAPEFPPLVTDKTQALYSGLEAQLRNIFIGMNASANDSFKERREELLQANGNEDRIAEIMWHPAYILPLLDLWSEPGSKLEPTPNLLNHIDRLCQERQQGYWGLLPLHKLLQLFFSRYDELKHIKELGETLRKQFEPEDRNLLFGLDKFKKHAANFLNSQGHEHLAALTVGSSQTLAQTARRHGIPTENSRFFEAAQAAYYVTRLKRLKPNEADRELLYEVQDGDVYGKRLDRNSRLGHEVLRILIEKLRDAGETPSDLWRGTLLVIGGDPRLPASSLDWWKQLGEEYYAQQMIEWLSELDLNLFLQLFDDLAKDPSNKDRAAMSRMFPARKRFLRGLLDRKLIRCTRLFLSRKALEYVEDILSNNEKKDSKLQNRRDKKRHGFAEVSGSVPSRFAAFYLDLETAHMVEGTHNFALRIMDKVPDASPLKKFETSSVPITLLKTTLENQYKKQFGDYAYDQKFLSRMHDPSGNWIEIAVNHLNRKLLVAVSLKDVTDENPYRHRSSTWG